MSDEEALLEVLSHANAHDPGYFAIVGSGDLRQMSAQYRLLKDAGIDVGLNDVFPAVRDQETRTAALRVFWEKKAPGWWNMRAALVAAGVCSEREFEEAM